MPKYLTQEEAFMKCKKEGKFIVMEEIDRERIRTKRNGINYYGTPVSFDDWKEVELQFNLYIKRLMEEIKNKLKS